MFDHDIMTIAQNIMMFACDIMVFIHEIIGGGGDMPPDTLKQTLFIYLVIEKRDLFIYHAFEKSDPFIYLIVQNFDLYTIIYKYFDFLNCVCQQKSAL